MTEKRTVAPGIPEPGIPEPTAPPYEAPAGTAPAGTAPDGTAPEGAARTLWNRNFRLFFLARTVARFGDGMVPVALAAGLLDAGYGASSVSFALGAWMACFAGFVLVGGVKRAVRAVARSWRMLAVGPLVSSVTPLDAF
ncbi:hypothetical protein ACFXKX_05280 [Streptomyces scopuliridis]|uniref:hypothetical protein n=1 Tax=Streptomyces scopuliridis TaxID=452529 RepID=UPI0036899816